jgi:hypothetical protein
MIPMSLDTKRSLAIYYEHPDWFRPLFSELDRRGTPYVKLHAGEHRYDPTDEILYPVFFNRMSPSAYTRGRGRAIFYTSHLLSHLERRGVRVINGAKAWRTEVSKADQLSLLQDLELPHPLARVIHEPADAPAAAEGLRFPIVVKPNVGGSGAGIRKFETMEGLKAEVAAGSIDLGVDGTALVQEFIPAQDGRIVRVEVLDGKYLYAIRVYSSGDQFNLCPADVCQGVDGAELERAACALDAPKNGLKVEGYTPPSEVIFNVERIMAHSGIELGGVEYMIDARDGQLYYYDVNALSNFVADPLRIIGFDPFAKLADWLEREVATERVSEDVRVPRRRNGTVREEDRAVAKRQAASRYPTDEVQASVEATEVEAATASIGGGVA